MTVVSIDAMRQSQREHQLQTPSIPVYDTGTFEAQEIATKSPVIMQIASVRTLGSCAAASAGQQKSSYAQHGPASTDHGMSKIWKPTRLLRPAPRRMPDSS